MTKDLLERHTLRRLAEWHQPGATVRGPVVELELGFRVALEILEVSR